MHACGTNCRLHGNKQALQTSHYLLSNMHVNKRHKRQTYAISHGKTQNTLLEFSTLPQKIAVSIFLTRFSHDSIFTSFVVDSLHLIQEFFFTR